MPRARLQRAAPERRRPAGRGDRGRRPGSGRGRGARDGRRARRRVAADDASRARSSILARCRARARTARPPSGSLEILDVAIDDHGEAHWATTGGSTPAAIYRQLAAPPLRDEIDWRKVQLWWTDERFVPPDHPLSNAKIATSDLLEIGALSGESGTGESGADVAGGGRPASPIPAEQRPPDPDRRRDRRGPTTRTGPRQRYAEELRADGPDANDDGCPAFDLMLLGVGPDGHILSRLPGLRGVRPDGAGARRSRRRPTSSRTSPRVTLNPRIVAGGARRSSSSSTARRRPRSCATSCRATRRRAALPAQLARRAGRDVDPRRGGGPRSL